LYYWHNEANYPTVDVVALAECQVLDVRRNCMVQEKLVMRVGLWFCHRQWSRKSNIAAVDIQLLSSTFWPCSADRPRTGVHQCCSGAHNDADWVVCHQGSHLQGVSSLAVTVTSSQLFNQHVILLDARIRRQWVITSECHTSYGSHHIWCICNFALCWPRLY